MKMKKYLSIVLGVLLTLSLQSCFVNPDYNEEVAFKMRPWFFGDNDVSETPATDLTLHSMHLPLRRSLLTCCRSSIL